MLSFHTLLCYVACLHICYRKETWTCLLVQATSSSSDDCVNCSNPQHPKQLNTLRLVSIKLNWKFREECFLSVISVNLFSCQIVTHHKPFLTLSVIAFFLVVFIFTTLFQACIWCIIWIGFTLQMPLHFFFGLFII